MKIFVFCTCVQMPLNLNSNLTCTTAADSRNMEGFCKDVISVLEGTITHARNTMGLVVCSVYSIWCPERDHRKCRLPHYSSCEVKTFMKALSRLHSSFVSHSCCWVVTKSGVMCLSVSVVQFVARAIFGLLRFRLCRPGSKHQLYILLNK